VSGNVLNLETSDQRVNETEFTRSGAGGTNSLAVQRKASQPFRDGKAHLRALAFWAVKRILAAFLAELPRFENSRNVASKSIFYVSSVGFVAPLSTS
jgi:hypothetical protein